jgi:hypothetical protein
MKALLDGERSLSNIPLLVKRIIKDKMWGEFYVDKTKQLVECASFMQFVTAQPMEGLGTSIEMLKRICAEDKEAFDLIDQVTQGKQGERTDLVNNVNEVVRPLGNTRQRALRQLRKSRPDLHAQVLKGKLSPHAAMIEAGFRKKTMTIQSDPVLAAQYLKRRFTKTEFDAFKKELLA